MRRLAPLVVVTLAASAVATTVAAGCTPPTGPERDLVSGFRVSPVFNAFTQPCTIAYTLNAPAWVQIRVTDPATEPATLVRQITEERRETAGARSAAWRGVTSLDRFAPQGEYTIELYARRSPDEPWETWALSTIVFRN